MRPKLTTQEFIHCARAVHGEKYGYAFSVYVSSQIKITIYCKDHGLFQQTPNNHIKGRGCPDCSNTKKHTNDSFIKKAKIIHGRDTYDYSLVEYINNLSKVKIICKEHGLFEQTPNSHLNIKAGCPNCSHTKKHTRETFIEKSKKVHGDKYEYSFSVYKSTRDKLSICCSDHGVFEQTPADHIKGQGCPGCAKTGFDRTRSGFLYVLRSECGRYMKIGITNKPDQRHIQLARATPFEFSCIEIKEGEGECVAVLEKNLLSIYETVEFKEKFDGSTEWRLWSEDIREKLMEVV